METLASSSRSSLRQTVLITGATSGIGAALAETFSQEGSDLVLVARTQNDLTKSADRLRARYKNLVNTIALDLTEQNAADALKSELTKRGILIDVLINNAGFGLYGAFKDTDWQKEQQMIELNILALTRITKLFLPEMIARGTGRIVNIASTAAFLPGPLMAVYYASKAYVLSFGEALANELKGTGVTVTTICPGPTKSNFQATAAMEGSKLVQGEIMGPDEVATAAYEATVRGDRLKIVGRQNTLLIFLLRFMPRSLILTLSRAAVAPQ